MKSIKQHVYVHMYYKAELNTLDICMDKRAQGTHMHVGQTLYPLSTNHTHLSTYLKHLLAS